jgi:hypothetical protein
MEEFLLVDYRRLEYQKGEGLEQWGAQPQRPVSKCRIPISILG